MRKLIIKLLLLVLIPVSILVIIVFFIPPCTFFKEYLLFAQIDKEKLLITTHSPRIIFIGGSNLSFGLDSKRIKDSLNFNPINTGVHAGIGLKYMLAIVENFVHEGDIIIISPEYQQFFGDFANGSKELLSTVVNVAPKSIKLLDYKQYFKLFKSMPEIAIQKIEALILEKLVYNNISSKDTFFGIYDRKAFNSFGDACIHWNLTKEKVIPLSKIEGNLNEDVFISLIAFKNTVTKKDAKLYITYPCYQDLSYKNSSSQIKEIDNRLKKYGFNILSDPERYSIPDSLIYNTPYHLTKKGVDLRTLLLIEDLKKVL